MILGMCMCGNRKCVGLGSVGCGLYWVVLLKFVVFVVSGSRVVRLIV